MSDRDTDDSPALSHQNGQPHRNVTGGQTCRDPTDLSLSKASFAGPTDLSHWEELEGKRLNPSSLLRLIEPGEIKRHHIRALLTLMGTPKGEGLTSSTLLGPLNVSTRTLDRLKPVMIDTGLATVHAAPGSNGQNVWAVTTSTRQQLTASESVDLSALSLSSGKKSKGPDPLRFGDNKYESVLERDVAVCLVCLGVRHRSEFPYRKLIKHKSPDDWDENSIPNWRGDFIVEVTDGQAKIHGVIEVAGVKGNPAYRATLRQKALALVPVSVPYLQLSDADDLDKIPGFIKLLQNRATKIARSVLASSPASPAIPGGCYVTPSGRHIDPRGIKKRLEPGEIRRPPPSLYPQAPAHEVQPLSPMTPEERELRTATEALEEQRYEELKIALAVVRAEHKARYDHADAAATAQDRVKMLTAALAWNDEMRASRNPGSSMRHAGTQAQDDVAHDPEAPWEHSDLDEERGPEAHGGDLSDYL